ncbi:MAG: ATP-binding protein [Desulfuromonadia bacterium]
MTKRIDRELRVPYRKLRWECGEGCFDFRTTRELPDLAGTIGQERALKAIDFGLGMGMDGFNLFLAGESGTGRSSTIMNILNVRAKKEPAPLDWCYVYNFKEEDAPIFLSFPVGEGARFAADIRELIDAVRTDIPKALESKDYESNRSAIVEEFQTQNAELFAALEKQAEERNFSLQRTVSGLVMVPQKEGRNFTQEEYEALSEDERKEIEEHGNWLTERLNDVLRQVKENEKSTKEKLAQLDRDLGLSAIGRHMDPLKKKYADNPKVIAHLHALQENMLENLDDFKPQPPQQSPIPGLKFPRPEPSFDRYTVNVFVDNTGMEGAPVVFESNPTYTNLFGRIEHVMQMGGVATTNFTLIKPGALHRANGGYLIIDARELLINPFSWDALKRCIKNGEIRIEDAMEQYRFMTFVTLRPEPIPLQAKIIMIGTPWIYYLLYYLEPDYRKLFKVRADFDDTIPRTRESLRDYALFVATHCRREKLLHFDRSGVAALVEYSARLVEDQEKLSSQFMEITDLIREASYWAKKGNKRLVNREMVKRAIRERIFRSNRIEERMQEMFEKGTILCDVKGSVVGQINGLSVITVADHRFGRPSRVTARVWAGRAGMVNIEREVKLSGPIHDKGVLILTGFLGGTFAQETPLSFSASICFEQNYEGVEGDSASSTELYALLSALSGVPLRQDLAVTGSVNQRGKIQPIGGVNEKIEGFYAVCKAKGLTGTQGVIIPKTNERHLMLDDEVVAAVKQGKFHLWSVETIEQGIELLTGMPAGERDDSGQYPEGTLYRLVADRLAALNKAIQKGGDRGDDPPTGKKSRAKRSSR